MKAKPSLEYVQQALSYDKETGEFRWLERPLSHFASVRACNAFNARYARTVAGAESNGYVCIKVATVLCKAHHLAWLLVTGEWPADEMDHIDHDGTNNRWSNLRLADRTLNCRHHTTAYRTNKAGLLGVVNRPRGRFQASICVGGKKVTIGSFGTAEQAHAAYVDAKRRLHSECFAAPAVEAFVRAHAKVAA